MNLNWYCLTNLLQDAYVNIDETVATIKQAAPWLTITGKPGSENAQFFVVCIHPEQVQAERQVFFRYNTDID